MGIRRKNSCKKYFIPPLKTYFIQSSTINVSYPSQNKKNMPFQQYHDTIDIFILENIYFIYKKSNLTVTISYFEEIISCIFTPNVSFHFKFIVTNTIYRCRAE